MSTAKKYYLIEVSLETTKSNVSIMEGKILNWIFSWHNNKITAFSISNHPFNISEDIFSLIVNTSGLNLGLLIDVLSMIINVEVNKSIAISTVISANIFEVPKPKKHIQKMVDMLNLKKSGKHLLNAGVINEEKPKRIDDSLTVNLGSDELKLIEVLLKKFELKNKYQVSDYKLLNYWRRGVDLDNLTLWDESYLAFFKILEYFENKASVKNNTIPSRFISKSQKSAYRIAKGSGLRRVSFSQYKMLSDFVMFRNNWDIAHTRVNMLPRERESALYFTYHLEMWDYHSHISEITRLMILKHLDIKKFKLVVEGGLYKLTTD